MGLVRTGKATSPHGHTYVSGSLHMNETEVGARIDDVVLAPPNMRGTYYAPYPYDSYPYDGPSGYPADYLDPDSGNNDPPPADPSAQPKANQDGPARAWRPEGAANTTHRKKWRVSDKQREENPTCDDGTWAPKMLKSWARRSRLLQLGHARRSKKEGMGGKSRLRPVESSVM